MLYVSELLLQNRQLTSFEQLVDVVRQRAKNEMFFRMDLKPPYPDTPENWELVLECAFSGVNDDA